MEEPSSASIRVAIADDHELFRRGLVELLSDHGFEVAGEARDGEEAVLVAIEQAPDVFVMDLNMPGTGGAEATRRIRAATPTTAVLMLTVSADEDDVALAVLNGACGYLLKDADEREIVAGVQAAAAGESTLSPRIASGILSRIRTSQAAPAAPEEVRPQLTGREREVLELVAKGRDNTEIAEALFISVATVKNHVSNILAKLEVDNRIQAAVEAVRRQML